VLRQAGVMLQKPCKQRSTGVAPSELRAKLGENETQVCRIDANDLTAHAERVGPSIRSFT